MLAATVLVPTHDHGPTLFRSVASALAQTVSDLEVLVVGDGAPDVTRELMGELTSSDPRVRFFDNPKGPRHGEQHRHAALSEAQGEIVCYLSDDDLWLPHHVQSLLPLLEGAGFVGSTVVVVDADGGLRPIPHDLADPRWRRIMVRGDNRLPLSGAAHTMAAYRAHSPGWRPAPDGIATDLHFFKGFLEDPTCSAASCERPSVLNFGARPRRGMSAADRLGELERWWSRVSDPAELATLESAIAATWQPMALKLDLKHRRRRLRRRGLS